MLTVTFLNTFWLFLHTCELIQRQELRGGAGRSVIQLVQHNLLVSIEEVRAEARDGCCWAAHIVSERITARVQEKAWALINLNAVLFLCGSLKMWIDCVNRQLLLCVCDPYFQKIISKCINYSNLGYIFASSDIIPYLFIIRNRLISFGSLIGLFPKMDSLPFQPKLFLGPPAMLRTWGRWSGRQCRQLCSRRAQQ